MKTLSTILNNIDNANSSAVEVVVIILVVAGLVWLASKLPNTSKK